MTTVADYANRTADLFAFRGLFPAARGRDQLLVQELVRPGDSGLLIAGIEKLAQRVLTALLLRRGTKTYRSTDGTHFMTDAVRGYWRTPADVETSFYSARLDLSRQVTADETDADPDDEKWGSLDLTGVIIAAGNVTLRLSLTSAAGTAYTFLSPIAVPIK